MMQWIKAYEQRLAALKVDDVKRVMNKYLKLEKFLIIKAGICLMWQANLLKFFRF
jgi:predicted Zn-dependent peptidase